jgi:hypothetical protein
MVREEEKGEEITMVWSRYRIEFGCVDGRMGAYLGDTKEQVQQAIDRDSQTTEFEKSCLKFGYFWEFTDVDYVTKEYVIDNGIHFIWEVKEKTDGTIH